MDIVSPEVRRRMMQGIKGKNTTPERVVRSIAHGAGLRFRLHAKHLPGTPDLVFPRHKTVVFVHGCFWHRHNCKLAASPKTRPDFWQHKFEQNMARDKIAKARLEDQGWQVVIIWECETREPSVVLRKLSEAMLARNLPPEAT